jgi:hypothetical protein
MPPPVNVVRYTSDAFKRILVEKTRSTSHILDTRSHCAYLEEYFQQVGAATIVVENSYIDRDFLEDYAAYYVRCFSEYQHKCTRLHFFSMEFDESYFSDFLSGNVDETRLIDLRNSYIGFMVIKPLPETIFGRTCLKTYGPDGGRRWFPIVRPYRANLFGIELDVLSLAFQEQDSVVAACATSALWSMFHGTGITFQHAIPTPVEITKVSTASEAPISRVFPNEGLTASQMAHAIRSVGLEPYYVGACDEYELKGTVYA